MSSFCRVLCIFRDVNSLPVLVFLSSVSSFLSVTCLFYVDHTVSHFYIKVPLYYSVNESPVHHGKFHSVE